MSQSVRPDRMRGSVAWISGEEFDIDLTIGVENKPERPRHRSDY